jgi:hypothetical protein
MLLPSLKRVTPQRPLFFGYCIAKNQNKPGKKQSFENVNNQAIFTMFLKERGVRSSDLKAHLVYRWR